MHPIIDLHCDLLSFLAEDSARTVDDPLSKASYTQMKEGYVSLQTLAIFTKSDKGSFAKGKKQVEAFINLLEKEPSRYEQWDVTKELKPTSPIALVTAFENAYGFSEEGEPIQIGLSYLDNLLKILKNILYISLTWDGENRFGGGNGSSLGLKEDGKRVLEWLDRKQIAVDLSHSSDFLADGIFNYIDKKNLSIPVMASHSNARFITNKERNLPDEIAREIFKRGGIVGLNLFSPFLGKQASNIAAHVEHFMHLGGEKNICFGADFFPELDFEYLKNKYQVSSCFFPELNDASCYPRALCILEKSLSLKESQLKGIAYENFSNYIKKTFEQK